MFLEISDLKKSFGEGDSKVQVLKGIDLSVDKGEICVLLGPSGSGKSTLLNIIGGIDSPDSGYVSIDGEDGGYDGKTSDQVPQRAFGLCIPDVQSDPESQY